MEIVTNDIMPVKKKRSILYKIYLLFFSLLLLFSLVYFTVSLISANKTLRTYNEMYGNNEDEASALTFVPYSTAFMEARYSMSKVDSVSLSINLSDSVAALEMGGVVVFQAPLEGGSVSPLLKAMKPEALSNLMRSPARVVSYDATIDKEEIIIKKAPRDTIEAALDDDALPVAIRQAAFYTLILESGVRIVVMPHKESGRFVYVARQNLFLFRQRVAAIFRGELPNYIPIVNIEVSADDAKTLFRAMPEHAQVALKF
jgi:hypothetical protein